ncbi:MAG: molybdenum cofactor guanylyltransferase [Nocardioidaceae bacterium]
MTTFDAVVLTGGRAERLGGTPKADLVVAGTSLRDRALAAVSGAERVQVVGPEVRGGPVAALASALPRVGAPLVVVLACDMPLLGAPAVARLVAAVGEGVGEADGAMLVDDGGRQQFLAAAYRTASLRSAIGALDDPDGASMRALVGGLRVHEVTAQAGEALDCDTWSDVRRATALLEER